MDKKRLYCFLSDSSGNYYQATPDSNSNYNITSSPDPKPIKYNPSNIVNTTFEFATNAAYFSLNRSISYPLDFIKDGAAILRHIYFEGKGIEEDVYLTVIIWNGVRNVYELCYKGKIDFIKKDEETKGGIFKTPSVDDTCWGVLSKNDTNEYAIGCNAATPGAIRVLFDGITLLNKATFQTVASGLTQSGNTFYYKLPFVLINQDGDTAGVIFNNQTSQGYAAVNNSNDAGTIKIDNSMQDSISGWFFETNYAIQNVHIYGSIKYQMSAENNRSAGLQIYFYTNLRQKVMIEDRNQMVGYPGHPANLPMVGKWYTVDFDFYISMAAGEKISFAVNLLSGQDDKWTITPEVTNIVIETKTTTQPLLAYARRPHDVLLELSRKATNGRFKVDSDYFLKNNNTVILSGDAIRGKDNSQIYSSFKDFFTTFNSLNFMAIKSLSGDLFMEKAVDIYNNDTDNVLDLGECVDVTLKAAERYYANEVIVGSPKQDYRHPSGRLEFNSTNTFTIPSENVRAKYDIVTAYRTGCYDIIFLILDYQGGSTTDNSGDKSVYAVEISDELAYASEDLENFESVSINNATLEPIIISPADNEVINNTRPTIIGIATPTTNVRIYVDGALDGNVTSDANGDWTYDIVNDLSSYAANVTTGLHTVSATFGDMAAPKSEVILLIDTTVETPFEITYPRIGDGTFNNLPLVKGVAPFGSAPQVYLDSVAIATVTPNRSGKWQFRSPLLSEGDHELNIDNGSAVFFHVEYNPAYPIITYIGRDLDSFPVLNNLPLIKGIAIPLSEVTIWLDYITYTPLGHTFADNYGNWEYQVTPRNYPDPISGISIVLSPIKNGLNIISTSLAIKTIPIQVAGYKLKRPPFSTISGVPDNTVFNVPLSPKRMLMNHFPMISAMLEKRPDSRVVFQTADKNGNFFTTLDGVTIRENSDVLYSELGAPIAHLENVIVKTKTLRTFSESLYQMNNSTLVKVNYKGVDLFLLPIGSMKMSAITSDVQEWTLLLSTKTPYLTLLSLFKNGTLIKIMKNSIYRTDYNSLHFAKYDYVQPAKYSSKELYDDWFENRNSAWSTSPKYIQKFQKTDVIVDQVIANGISNIKLKAYSCGKVVRIINYAAVPNIINSPDILLEAVIDFSTFDEGVVFFVMEANNIPVCISEMINVREVHKNTILIESANSYNTTGAFFQTGFKTILRVEGIVKKLQPSIVTIVADEEDGDKELLYSSISRKRVVRFGSAFGLPDYLYLKVASALLLDELQVEGVDYTISKDEKITPSDSIEGHPLFYYNVTLDMRTNEMSNTFAAASDAETGSVVLAVDPVAMGLPAGSFININIE